MIIFGCLTLMGFIKLIVQAKKNSNKLFVLLSGTMLFLISALRSINFGTDTRGYVASYISLSYASFSELLINAVSGTWKDPFFYLIAKVISLTGASYRIWLAVIAGIFCYSISKLISKYSNEPYISFIGLISLGYFYFSLTGLRQTIALSILIISYKYLRERKLLPFILLIIFGSLFHATALIFLIAYPLAYMNIGWKQIVGIIAALIIAYFFKERVIAVLDYLNMADRYSNILSDGTSLTISGFIIQLAIYLFCLFFKKNIIESDKSNLCLFNLLFLGLVFQAFAAVIAEFFRVSMYFSIFGIILIPKAIISIKDKYIRIMVYLTVFLALVSYIFWAGSFHELEFFWQG